MVMVLKLALVLVVMVCLGVVLLLHDGHRWALLLVQVAVVIYSRALLLARLSRDASISFLAISAALSTVIGARHVHITRIFLRQEHRLHAFQNCRYLPSTTLAAWTQRCICVVGVCGQDKERIRVMAQKVVAIRGAYSCSCHLCEIRTQELNLLNLLDL